MANSTDPQGPGKPAPAPAVDPLDAAYDSQDPLDVMYNAHQALDTHINARNVIRSLGQGATLGFSDEMGLADRNAEKAFESEHPFVDAGLKAVGGAIPATAAVLAAPWLGAGWLGAATLGAGMGAATGVGEGDTAKDRLVGGAEGGVAGGILAGAGHAVGEGLSALASKIADRMHPERAVNRAARGLLGDDAGKVAGTMDKVNELAPGGASVYSSTIAPESKNPRFLTMMRGAGANPKAAAAMEQTLTGQKAALKGGARQLGAAMDQLDGDVEVTPTLRKAIQSVKSVLGGKTPSLGAEAEEEANPLGLERIQPVSFDAEKPTASIQDLRDALSRLRYMERQAVKRGVDANGVTLHDISTARGALQKEIYAQRPDFAKLDQNYATLADQMRAVNKGLKTVELSRQNYGGNEAYKATAGSIGGSLPHGSQGVMLHVLNSIMTDRAGAADAVRRIVATPGTSAAVRGIMATAPKAPSVMAAAARRGLLTSTAAQLPASLRGLLSPEP